MKNLLILLLVSILVAPAWGKDAAHLSLGVSIELKGSTQDVSALAGKLKKTSAYKAADCTEAKSSEESLIMACSKADGRLMGFLGRNAPATVQWSITSIVGARICPGTPGCQVMSCPPPRGPIMCCYQAPPYGPC